MRFSISPLLLTVLLCTCGPATLDAQFPYDLDHPELLAEMPEILGEISGLGMHGDELFAIQDEDGILFRLSTADGSVRGQYAFWGEGDYEGVEVVGDAVWVTKSNGRLYEILGYGTEDQEVNEYNTWLNGDNDVEGLAYDAANHRLLLACKDDPKGNGLDKANRYIFAFDLATRKLGEEAVFSIPREDDFAPSSLAIHPLTGQLFLTSSVGNQLLVARADGTIETVKLLDKQWFPQPEGLTFAPDGTLYLSTEARYGAPGRIYRLPYAK